MTWYWKEIVTHDVWGDEVKMKIKVSDRHRPAKAYRRKKNDDKTA